MTILYKNALVMWILAIMTLLPFQSANASENKDFSGRSIHDSIRTQLREHPEYFLNKSNPKVTIEDYEELLLHCERTSLDRQVLIALPFFLGAYLVKNEYYTSGITLMTIGIAAQIYEMYPQIYQMYQYVSPDFPIPNLIETSG